MPIEFLDLLDDEGWELRPVDPSAPSARWSEGGALADAPVDVAATFDDAQLCSTAIDPAFGLTGTRLQAGFTVPRHHHDQSLLRIVFGGSVEVRTDDESATVGPGQFCVVEPDTVHSLVAGPEGVTYLESWMIDAPEAVTTWHPDPAWVAR